MRDTDVAGRSRRLRIFNWSMLGGVVGGLLGVFGAVQGVWGRRMILLFASFGWAVSAIIPGIASLVSGRAARTLYTPSGRSTPRKKSYSLAESLAARGLYEDGIAAFEEAIAEAERLQPDSAEAAQIQAALLMRSERVEEATEVLQRLVSRLEEQELEMPTGGASFTERVRRAGAQAAAKRGRSGKSGKARGKFGGKRRRGP